MQRREGANREAVADARRALGMRQHMREEPLRSGGEKNTAIEVNRKLIPQCPIQTAHDPFATELRQLVEATDTSSVRCEVATRRRTALDEGNSILNRDAEIGSANLSSV